jgi:hypothetical protein
MYAGTGTVGNGDYTLDGGNLMTIHEYGADKEKVIVLIHPSVVMWDYFDYVIPRQLVISRSERRRQGIHEI